MSIRAYLPYFMLPLVFFLLIYCAWNSTQLRRTQLHNYFNLERTSIFDGELTRLNATGWPRYQIIKHIDELIPKDATVLVFRQSDFAFYAKRKFFSHFDEEIAELFRIKRIHDVWLYLRERGIDYLYVPHYSLPSIYNSQVGKLIASPQYTVLTFDMNAFRLYKVRENPRLPNIIAKAEEALSADTDRMNWLTLSGDGGFNRTSIPTSHDTTIIPISGEDYVGFRKARGFGRIVPAYGRVIRRIPAEELESKYSFEDPTRIHVFNAELHGNGLVEVFLARFAGEGVSRIPIWSGVLSESSQSPSEVVTQFLAPNHLGITPGSESPSQYWLIFTTQGSHLQVKSWRFMSYRETPLPFGPRQNLARHRFVDYGWFVCNKSITKHAIDFGFGPTSEEGQFSIAQYDSRQVAIQSPLYYPSNLERSSSDDGGITPLDRNLPSTVEIHLNGTIEGEATVYPYVDCPDRDKSGLVNQVSLVEKQSNSLDAQIEFEAHCTPNYIRMYIVVGSNKRIKDHLFAMKPATMSRLSFARPTVRVKSLGRRNRYEASPYAASVEATGLKPLSTQTEFACITFDKKIP